MDRGGVADVQGGQGAGGVDLTEHTDHLAGVPPQAPEAGVVADVGPLDVVVPRRLPQEREAVLRVRLDAVLGAARHPDDLVDDAAHRVDPPEALRDIALVDEVVALEPGERGGELLLHLGPHGGRGEGRGGGVEVPLELVGVIQGGGHGVLQLLQEQVHVEERLPAVDAHRDAVVLPAGRCGRRRR